MNDLFGLAHDSPPHRFADRRDAGRRLAERLSELSWHEPVVLGLVRGGVPVAAEVAARLGGELDVAVARKIGAPGNPEAAIGAVTAKGEPVYDGATLRALHLAGSDLAERVDRERATAERQERSFRSGTAVTGRNVIVVDDGLATGLTARAALHAVRGRKPRSLTLAAPVASADAVRGLRGGDADEIITLDQPPGFRGVGEWYERFRQVSDDEVLTIVSGYQSVRK